ncbi:aldose 1-epimerase [Leucothrix pacifica]|uniref:Aldose 1-epimerase n=1 Tax=Leucothrix pacifica TaxID=1247513 RepID=A0A317CAX1_9GAMM|nr:aldose 1-epimerase [Leucothrix pacifica]PWQ95835.1 hypothetical protein DKW60_14140 [Leucothrix pacifica]
MFEISTSQARVQVREDLGAAVASYNLVDGRAVFRPAPTDAADEFDMACNIMLPWCNRISDGGFYVDDVFYPLAPNREGDALPLHGNAFQQVWTLKAQTESSVTLTLESTSLTPFHYLAEVTYVLHGADLAVKLSVKNLSNIRLPYGVGLHPWFIQEPDTLLTTSTETVILTDQSQLPVKSVSLEEVPEWDFRTQQHLPKDGFDHCFTGWSREALISWPSRQLQLNIQADEALSYCHIYSRNNREDFFCFEPVSHPLNAHNWPDRSLSTLKILEQGEVFLTSCVFKPSQI